MLQVRASLCTAGLVRGRRNDHRLRWCARSDSTIKRNPGHFVAQTTDDSRGSKIHLSVCGYIIIQQAY